MSSVMVKMLHFMRTPELEEIKKIKNLMIYTYVSFVRSKNRINNEVIERDKNMIEIMKDIASKDSWFSKEYRPFNFGNSVSVVHAINNAKKFFICHMPIFYSEMRFLSHIISNKLICLSFCGCFMNEAVLECFIGISFPALEALKFEASPIGDKSIRVINMWSIPNLRFLNMNFTDITTVGIYDVCLLHSFANIQYFHCILDINQFNENEKIDPVRILELDNLTRFICRRSHLKSLRNVKKSLRYKFGPQKHVIANAIHSGYEDIERGFVIDRNYVS